MVYLNRIYTRAGDDGQTGLGDGTRVSKTHPRIMAYGGVDELNSVLGVALAVGQLPEPWCDWLLQIQNDLFDLGADLCVPMTLSGEESDGDSEASPGPLRMIAAQVETLEQWIDAANAPLSPLNSFVLPGGAPSAAYLHLARTVCRRVEIAVLHLAEFEDVNPQANIYLNRLSDLLFVLARACNARHSGDVLWVPGQNR